MIIRPYNGWSEGETSPIQIHIEIAVPFILSLAF
jgi:hypothetical protein